MAKAQGPRIRKEMDGFELCFGGTSYGTRSYIAFEDRRKIEIKNVSDLCHWVGDDVIYRDGETY